jgi:hypothetical protein
MTSSARKDLERQGFRTYIVRGDRLIAAIDREGPRKFSVRNATFPRNGFFSQMFKRLRDARSYAEWLAGFEERV